MRYAKIVYNDVVNSSGLALTFYCQGCTHHCPGCFNKGAWSFSGGNPFSEKEIAEMRYYLENYPCDNVVLLGGEPFDNLEVNLIIADLAKEYNKSLWCYTGYLFEELANKPESSKAARLLKQIDVLIDGEFREEMKNPLLKFKGSANQRIINVQESLSKQEVVLYE